MLCINEMFIVDRWERVKKRGLFSLESFSRVLFLARAVVATCSGQPSLLSCLDGNFHSFQPLGRCQTPRWPTCRPPGSVGSPASLPFPSSLLNLCPASQHPWSVSPVALALSAEDLLPASCWLSSWKWKQLLSSWLSSSRNLRQLLQLPVFWLLMAGFYISVVTSIEFVNFNGPWGRIITG